MSINFKQPKYILPLVALPFLCLFFYVYHNSGAKSKKQVKPISGFNASVGDVSPDIKKKELTDKLDAYRNTYKEADGSTAVNAIPSEKSADPGFHNDYSAGQKRTLDSINRAMKMKFAGSASPPGISAQDREMEEALNHINHPPKNTRPVSGSASPVEKDPMQVFRQQMAYMDSIRKSEDPAYLASQKELAKAKAADAKPQEKALAVTKADAALADFNTIRPAQDQSFIMAIIDENVTGYADSRIRLRLLEDIMAGGTLIKKGSYLYALISGFTGQRVSLSVKSILYENQELPVKLDVYDLDGLKGLYVPQSAFRDFTKDVGNNTIQGVSIGDNGTGSAASQLLMSTTDKIFESTSSAIAGAIRKDKAKIKYNSYIYLIDSQKNN
jgi:conjugative transposon TraM protein